MKRRGFTLIELLVVVSIIAILTAAGMAVFTNAQKGARDSRRRADIKAMQSASELYYQSTGSYPSAIGSATSFLDGGLVLVDPKNAGVYSYVFSYNGTVGYNHCATLEVAAGNFCAGNLQ